MEMLSIEKELQGNSYPGRGIIIGKSADGTKAVTAYFIMGRSENSRNRVFVEEGEGIRTQAFDPSKLTDPSLIIYAPVRVLGNKTIVTEIRQIPSTRAWTSSLHLNSHSEAVNSNQTDRTTHLEFLVLCILKMEHLTTQCQS